MTSYGTGVFPAEFCTEEIIWIHFLSWYIHFEEPVTLQILLLNLQKRIESIIQQVLPFLYTLKLLSLYLFEIFTIMYKSGVQTHTDTSNHGTYNQEWYLFLSNLIWPHTPLKWPVWSCVQMILMLHSLQ